MWSTFQALIQPFCNNGSFIKLDLPIRLVPVRQQQNRKKYFDLLALNSNWDHSDLWSTHGAMKFLNGELFSGSPGIIWI